MNTGTLLRALANGVNPDTGELLRPASAACAPEAIRLLFALANEFDGEAELQKKVRLTPEEKRQKNLAEGRRTGGRLSLSCSHKKARLARA